MISVILPVYNERNRLESCVARLEDYLEKEFDAYEILIVEDNSTDGSFEIAQRIAASRPSVVLMHNDRRLGRGTFTSCHVRSTTRTRVRGSCRPRSRWSSASSSPSR